MFCKKKVAFRKQKIYNSVEKYKNKEMVVVMWINENKEVESRLAVTCTLFNCTKNSSNCKIRNCSSYNGNCFINF